MNNWKIMYCREHAFGQSFSNFHFCSKYSLILLKISCHIFMTITWIFTSTRYYCWGFLDLIVQSENGFDRWPSLYSKNLVRNGQIGQSTMHYAHAGGWYPHTESNCVIFILRSPSFGWLSTCTFLEKSISMAVWRDVTVLWPFWGQNTRNTVIPVLVLQRLISQRFVIPLPKETVGPNGESAPRQSGVI